MAASGVFLLSINLAKSPCSAKLYWFIITGQLVIDRLCLSSKEAVSFVFYPLVKKTYAIVYQSIVLFIIRNMYTRNIIDVEC